MRALERVWFEKTLPVKQVMAEALVLLDSEAAQEQQAGQCCTPWDAGAASPEMLVAPRSLGWAERDPEQPQQMEASWVGGHCLT